MNELDIRSNNLIWTISNDYGIDVDLSFLVDEHSEEIYFYRSAIIGYLYKKFDGDTVLDFLQKYLAISKDIIIYMEIILEELLYRELIEERPGINDYRDYTIRYYGIYFEKYMRRNISQELLYCYYSIKTGEIPKTSPKIKLMIREILNIRIHSTKELLELLHRQVKNHFRTERTLDQHLSKENLERLKTKVEEHRIHPKKIKQTQNKDKLVKILDIEQVHSAEFTTDFLNKENLVNFDDQRETSRFSQSNEAMFRTAEDFYGVSILSPRHQKQLESKLCCGIHRGEKILVTKGEFRDTLNGQYKKNQIEKDKKNNMEHFKQNELMYHRFIFKLRHFIEFNLLQHIDHFKYRSSYGKLNVEKVWEACYLQQNKVFYHEFKDEPGKVKVDLLLDSSASQLHRQELVAAQAYIIATVLTDLNIPVRVSSYNNFYNYMILKLYRNYDDKALANEKIFEYSPSGSNRDGLAIETILSTMDFNSDEKNILIILSDGRPNDKVNLEKIGSRNLGALSYEGDKAIRDTANTVFQGRNKGVSILGVFTGEDEDLQKVKTIYGSDFAHIYDINRFSDIVGFFLQAVFDRDL